MIHLTTLALIILSIGFFTDEKVVEIGLIAFAIPTIKYCFDDLKNKSFKLPPSAYWLLSFIVIALISLWVNADVVTRISVNRNKLAIPLLGVFGIVTFRHWVTLASERSKKMVLIVLMLSCIAFAIHGISSYFLENQTRLHGMHHISKTGYVLCYFLILVGPLLIFKKNLVHPAFLISAQVIAASALFLTFSRAPLIALIGATPVCLYFYKKKLAYGVAIISATLALIMGGYYFFGKVNTDFRFLITKSNESDSQRTSIWRAAIIATKEKPLLGWGYFNFRSQMERIKYQYDLPNKKFQYHHAHNNMLEVAASTGLVGLFFFLGWIFNWAIETFRNKKTDRFILPFLTVFLIIGFFDMNIVDGIISVVMYLTYALGSSQITPLQAQPKASQASYSVN